MQIKAFQDIVGLPFVIISDEEKTLYSHDHTEDLSFMPEVVIKPATTNQIAEIVKICYDYNIPITPRGAGNI